MLFVFFVKQKTAYEMRISDWSSDVCSSDLRWLLAPIYFGLSLGLLALALKFFQEVFHIIPNVFAMAESELILVLLSLIDMRSEERRVGKECVSKGSSRWSTYY